MKKLLRKWLVNFGPAMDIMIVLWMLLIAAVLFWIIPVQGLELLSLSASIVVSILFVSVLEPPFIFITIWLFGFSTEDLDRPVEEINKMLDGEELHSNI